MAVRDRQPCVYILASGRVETLYTGVTSDLMGGLHQHRNGITRGFAHEHHAHHLAWYEMPEARDAAIQREKRTKTWNREWKLNLIERTNPEWVDLALALGFEPAGLRERKS